MSNFPSDPYSANTFATQPPPMHHTHRSSDALPGARGGVKAQDYSTDVTENPSVWREREDPSAPVYGTGSDTRAVVAGGQHDAPSAPSHGHSAFTEDRPLGVQPTQRGGVAQGGNQDLPEGHAKPMDKIIGKTQKITGKMMGNDAMHEKGELRESGGKMAAQGLARAPHD